MPLWGSKDQANNAPKHRFIVPSSNATGINAFGNVTPGAFGGARVANNRATAVGVFAEDANEAARQRQHNQTRAQHAGWVKVRQFTGPVVALAVANNGSGYNNSDFIRITGGANTVNATANIVTNGSGALTGFSNIAGGGNFANAAALTVTIRNAGDSGASAGAGGLVTITLGGRAGRVQMETLVAMGSITLDTTADNTLFPNT